MKRFNQFIYVFCFSAVCIMLFTQCESAAQKAIQITVDEANKMLPKRIDIYTTLDRLENKEKTLTYIYTVDGVDPSVITSEMNKRQVERSLFLTTSNDKELEALRGFDIIFIHEYRNKAGEALMSFTLTPDRYKDYKPELLNVLEELELLMNEQKKTLPMTVFEGLTILEAKVEAPNTLVYVNEVSSKEIETNIEKNTEAMKVSMIQSIRLDNSLASLRSMGVNFKYVYIDTAGKELLAVTITPEDYN